MQRRNNIVSSRATRLAHLGRDQHKKDYGTSYSPGTAFSATQIEAVQPKLFYGSQSGHSSPPQRIAQQSSVLDVHLQSPCPKIDERGYKEFTKYFDSTRLTFHNVKLHDAAIKRKSPCDSEATEPKKSIRNANDSRHRIIKEKSLNQSFTSSKSPTSANNSQGMRLDSIPAKPGNVISCPAEKKKAASASDVPSTSMSRQQPSQATTYSNNSISSKSSDLHLESSCAAVMPQADKAMPILTSAPGKETSRLQLTPIRTACNKQLSPFSAQVTPALNCLNLQEAQIPHLNRNGTRINSTRITPVPHIASARLPHPTTAPRRSLQKFFHETSQNKPSESAEIEDLDYDLQIASVLDPPESFSVPNHSTLLSGKIQSNVLQPSGSAEKSMCAQENLLSSKDGVGSNIVVFPFDVIQDDQFTQNFNSSEISCVEENGSRSVLLATSAEWNSDQTRLTCLSEFETHELCPILHLNSNDTSSHVSEEELRASEGASSNSFTVSHPSTSGSPEQIDVEEEEHSRGSRKRQKNPKEWKKVKAKEALDRGERHLSVRGKVIPARTMGEGCSVACRFKCSSKITEEDRKIIFEKFWQLGDHTRQWDFIRCNTKVSEPKSHNVQHGHMRKSSTQYFFDAKKEKVRVCQTMFLKTLAISEKWCRTVRRKFDASGVTISPDKRGLHSKVKPCLKEKTEKNIMDHINMFPRVSSHYCRAKSKRQYLDSSLSLAKMYKSYLKWMEKWRSGDRIASEKKYREIFCNNFNLSFFKPKKDQCSLCSAYRLATEQEKKRLETAYKNHISNKDLARKQKDVDKNNAKDNPTVCCAIFDLQQVLSVPKSENDVLYYLRKLSVYNFSVYDVVRKKGYCYMWSENEAKRGANEIASALLMFIEMMVKDEGVKEFRFWSDNCSGQNKNKHLFGMYTYASAKLGIKIYHGYLEKGHTQNECDSLHATVARAAKSKEIFTPKQWMEIVKNAKQEGHPYTVVEMVGEVLDFHLLTAHQKWTHKEAKWKQVRQVYVTPEHEAKIFLKCKHDQPEYVEINVAKQGRGRPFILKNFQFLSAYDGYLQLKRNKLKDLHQMCNTLVIPSQYHNVFKSLIGFSDLTNPILEGNEGDDEGEEESGDDNDFEEEDENNNALEHEELVLQVLEREGRNIV